MGDNLKHRLPRVSGTEWVSPLLGMIALVGLVGCVVPPSFQAPGASPPTSSWQMSFPSSPNQSRDLVLLQDNDDKNVLPLPRIEDSSSDDSTTLPAPREQSAGEMTFQQVVLACLQNDPKLRAGLEQIRQAQGDFITSSLKPNPEILTDIQLLPLENWTPERTGGPPQFDFFIAYPIDWWLFGKRAAEMQAADQGVRVSEVEFTDLVRVRVTEAAEAYFDVLESKALVEVARQDLENYQLVEESLRKAVEAGGRPQLELHRIRLDTLQSAQTLREAIAKLEKDRAKLKALIGIAEEDSSFDVSGSLDVPAEPPEAPSSEEAYLMAQQHRPDLEALRGKIAQAQAEIEVEDRKAYPEVKPMVGYTRQFQRKALGEPDANSYNFALEATLPWHDRNQGNRLKARSVMAQSQHEFRAGLVELRAEVDQALIDYRLAVQDTRAIAGEQLRLAREVRTGLSTSYKEGGRPLLDFLDAQRNFRETFKLYVTSRADYWRAVVRLIAVTGKQELLHAKPTPILPVPARP